MTALARQPATLSQRDCLSTTRFVLPTDSEYEAIPDEVEPGAQERIKGIVKLMNKKVNEFVRQLRPREQAQFDHKDVLQELWIALLEKDHYFDPERGIKYTTWSEHIIKQRLGEIWLRSHMVTAPRDTGQRLGDCDSQSPAMLMGIRQALADVLSLDIGIHEGYTTDPDQPEDAYKYSDIQIKLAFRRLPARESTVLGLKYGLRGREPMSMNEIADFLGGGITASAAGKMCGDAEKSLISQLQSNEPSYTSD